MIDLHCHLDLYPEPLSVRDECVRQGLFVLSVTTTPSAWNGTAALAGDVSRIRTALGLHPQIAHERQNELELFDRLLPATRYVGEVGLDGTPEYRKHWKSQTTVFEHVLSRCCDAGGRIMSIHSRRATAAVLEYLKSFPSAGIPILHWFSGSLRDLDRAAAMGCWFSVGPAMLLGEKGRSLVARMPRERVLTESDGPFARINEIPVMPWQVRETLPVLGTIWGTSLEDAERAIAENFHNLIGAREAV